LKKKVRGLLEEQEQRDKRKMRMKGEDALREAETGEGRLRNYRRKRIVLTMAESHDAKIGKQGERLRVI